MYDESGEARKTTASATSYVDPARPIGIQSKSASACAAFSSWMDPAPDAEVTTRFFGTR
jgi:hypothetical protein